jgi:hypothetical protein
MKLQLGFVVVCDEPLLRGNTKHRREFCTFRTDGRYKEERYDVKDERYYVKGGDVIQAEDFTCSIPPPPDESVSLLSRLL